MENQPSSLITSEERIARLPLWHGRVRIEPLAGGMTNENFLVQDERQKAVVRLGDNIPIHHISRANELMASNAASQVGISPAVLYHAPGALVLEFIEGQTLTEEKVNDRAMLLRITETLKICHWQMPRYISGQPPFFWVFHVLLDYARTLNEQGSRHNDQLSALMAAAETLERAAGPFEIVFGHNDLLAANFIDDGNKLWMIDWEYAGFNTPLFDLGGVASNSGLSNETEKWLLEEYFEKSVSDELWRRYQAMKCASLLRESLWGMVSEIYSVIKFDYADYATKNLQAFENAYADFRQI